MALITDVEGFDEKGYEIGMSIPTCPRLDGISLSCQIWVLQWNGSGWGIIFNDALIVVILHSLRFEKTFH